MERPPFVEHCSELLASLGAVRVRRMFGGWGLYVDGLFIALIAYERLYLKVHASAREHFASAGCEPFVYNAGNKQVSLGYWTAPDAAMDSPAMMQPWARLALQAALAARAAKIKPVKAARPTQKATGQATVQATGQATRQATRQTTRKAATKPAAKPRRA